MLSKFFRDLEIIIESMISSISILNLFYEEDGRIVEELKTQMNLTLWFNLVRA